MTFWVTTTMSAEGIVYHHIRRPPLDQPPVLTVSAGELEAIVKEAKDGEQQFTKLQALLEFEEEYGRWPNPHELWWGQEPTTGPK